MTHLQMIKDNIPKRQKSYIIAKKKGTGTPNHRLGTLDSRSYNIPSPIGLASSRGSYRGRGTRG